MVLKGNTKIRKSQRTEQLERTLWKQNEEEKLR